MPNFEVLFSPKRLKTGNVFFGTPGSFRLALDIEIVTTPTTTSTQPNLTTIEVGLEAIMTLHHHHHHHHPPPTTTETFRTVPGIVQARDFICNLSKPNLTNNHYLGQNLGHLQGQLQGQLQRQLQRQLQGQLQSKF